MIFDPLQAVTGDDWLQTRQGRRLYLRQEKLILDLVAPVAGESVLDVGCGSGNTLRMFGRKKCLLTGMDPSAAALESARELARGGIALPDSKRLAAAMGVDLDRVSGLLDIASRAGLVALDSGRWMPAEASRTWMVDSSGERWALLATAWLERLPVDIRTILRERAHAVWGERLEEYVAWLFPAGDDWMRDRVRVYTRDAELLGITADNVPSTPGAALLASGADGFPPCHECPVRPRESAWSVPSDWDEERGALRSDSEAWTY